MDYKDIIDNEFRGCCMITHKDDVEFAKAYGFSHLPNEILNDLDTKFATASAGKVFVAIGILQLMERNFLNIQDTVGDLLDIDLYEIDPKITVKQLLTHTSGIQDYFEEDIMDDYEELWKDYPNYKIRTNKDLLPLFIEKPMMYPRGDRFQYNNAGYVILALIIEKITSMAFDKYLKINIFDKCKMNDTGYYELDRLPRKCATNYIYDESINGYRTNIYSVDVKGTGAGGVYTTLGDISKFWNCLLGNKLLSKDMTSEMLSCQSGGENTGYYGYGVWLRKFDDNSYMPYFQGCDPGVSFISSYFSKEERIVTLVSNYGDNVWKIMRNIGELM